MGNDIGSGVLLKSVCFDFFSTNIGSSVIGTCTSNGFDDIAYLILTFFFSYFNRLKIDQLFQYLDVQIRIHKAFDRNFLQFASSYGMPSQDCPLISRLLKFEMDSFQAKFSVALKL